MSAAGACELEVVHPMSVAIRGLSAAGAVALTLGIVTQPSGSAAQTPGHERADGKHSNQRVAVLVRPAKHFNELMRQAHQRIQHQQAVREASVANDSSSASGASASADGGFPSPESVGVSSSTLQAIAACESGGDPTAVSADGTYHGLYQFDFGTWASVGGSGDPSAASPAEQTYRAALLYSRSGSNPWPICGS
jgi:soluble lytic murein transglycosylase-like protein